MPELTLTQISGIGPATARVLTENGFATVEAVSKANSAALAKVPGFGSARAAVIIASATSLQSESGTSGSRKTTKEAAKKKSKKKDKKKKNKKGKGKKKDKKGKGKKKDKKKKRNK